MILTMTGFQMIREAFIKLLGTDTSKLGTVIENDYTFTVHDTNGSTSVGGRNNLHTEYRRIADINQVIDPATTNVIDTYVLIPATMMQITEHGYSTMVDPTRSIPQLLVN